MKWEGGKKSSNFEDRRGLSKGGKLALGGGLGGIIVLVISLLMGGDPSQLMEGIEQMQQMNSSQSIDGQPREIDAEEQRLTDFTLVTLQSTEDVWARVFKDQVGENYRPATLVVYDNNTPTDGCGQGKSAYGPFYCSGDEKVYLDLTFNEELVNDFGATGEFALAYVIAHEIGHHVQNLLGTLNKTHVLQAKLGQVEANKISVMTELQADFYAGVWAHYTNKYSDVSINGNDILDGMRAASSVGDDRIQEKARGYSDPESFTHGTSEQRMYWFKKGYETGDLKRGDTFNDPLLK